MRANRTVRRVREAAAGWGLRAVLFTYWGSAYLLADAPHQPRHQSPQLAMKGPDMTEIHPKITEVLAETFKVPADEIIPSATMDSLEMDSLAVAEFAVIIKETLGVDADAEEVLRTATLAEISAFLDRALVGVTP